MMTPSGDWSRATVGLLARRVQELVADLLQLARRARERQPERIDVELAAGGRVRRDHQAPSALLVLHGMDVAQPFRPRDPGSGSR
jgi:hypothetical protein